MSDGPSLAVEYVTDELRSFKDLLEIRDDAFLADLIEALSQECVRRGYPAQAVELRNVAEHLRDMQP